MSKARSTNNLPTHAQLSDYISSILPIHPTDIPFQYHTPRYRQYNPAETRTNRLILSITPTAGVYTKLGEPHQGPRGRPACFLHRPFGLDRRAVPRGVLVLASHKRFDEVLTVGYNVPLATTLQLELNNHVRVQGYKNDPERLMGLVAPLERAKTLHDLQKTLLEQFGTCELYAEGVDHTKVIRAIALTNAFNVEMVQRVADASAKKAWVQDVRDCGEILYITGQERESGLQAAGDIAMPVICVGHRACEEWGIRWLGRTLRAAYPSLDVVEVLGPEEERPKQ